MGFPFASKIPALSEVSAELRAALRSLSGREAPKVTLVWSSPGTPGDRNTSPRLAPVTSMRQDLNHL